MADRLEDVRVAIEPLLAPLDMELVDVEMVGSGRASTLRITVDREGGVDLDAIAVATEAVSAALDRLDPIMGSYALEVSSPGIERPLRRPDDFARHLGSKVSVKTHAQADGARRHHGVIVASDDESFTIEDESGATRTFSFEETVQVRTVFDWGAVPKGSISKGPVSKGSSRSTMAGRPSSGIKERAGR